MRKFTVVLGSGESVDIEADSIVLSTSYVQANDDGKGVTIPVLEFNNKEVKKDMKSAVMAALHPSGGLDTQEQVSVEWVCVAAIFEPWKRITSVSVE